MRIPRVQRLGLAGILVLAWGGMWLWISTSRLAEHGDESVTAGEETPARTPAVGGGGTRQRPAQPKAVAQTPAEGPRAAPEHGTGRLVGHLAGMKIDRVPVAQDAFDEIRRNEVGTGVRIDLPGVTFEGTLDSVLIRDGAAHYGVTLDGRLGRAVVTLIHGDRLSGNVFFEGESYALTFSGSLSTGGWVVSEDRYEDIVCSRAGSVYWGGIPSMPIEPDEATHESSGGGGELQTVVILNSRPGADHVIYLDFDGEKIAHPRWYAGIEIDAAWHERHGDAQWVTQVWRRVAEDWAPFEINITTDRGIYDDTPVGQRMHCIITPTDLAARGAGGVAIRHSFPNDVPCWAFNSGEYSCADTISHEVGHTMGLTHHGRAGSPPQEYYGGQGVGLTSWSPLMGAAWADPQGQRYLEHVTQWSQGDYDGANNWGQEDLSVIARVTNGFGYRLDDTGSSMADAEPLNLEGNTIEDAGVIERNGDADWFEFATSGGAAEIVVGTLDVMSAYEQMGSETAGANLAVELQLFDSGGAHIETSNPVDELDAAIVRSLAAGSYFIRIAGAGRGDSSTGFSGYASLGQYEITGTIPAAVSGPEIRVTGNGVRVLDGSTTPSAGNGTDFGRVDYILGQSYDQAFVIENQGGQALTIHSVNVDSSRYSIFGDLPASVPAESSSSFILRYTPTGPAVDSTTVTILNGDVDEGQFEFAVTGEGIQGTFDDEYEENDTLATAADISFDEQTIITGRQADEDWYRIYVNPGFTRILVNLDFAHAEGDIDLSLHDSTGMVLAESAGAGDSESIDLEVGAGGDYYLRVHYANAWNQYELCWDDVRPVVDPDIELRGGGGFEYTIENGEDDPRVLNGTDLGSAPVIGGVVDRDFRIVNVGRGPLTIDAVSVDSPEFSVVSAPVGILQPEFQAVLTVRFDPASVGDHAGTVEIESDDPGDDPFTFAVRGVGVDAVVDDAYEENDTMGSAFDLRPHAGTWISAVGGSGVQLDEDWYEIVVPAGSNRVQVECLFYHEQGDIDIELVDSGGASVSSSRGVTDDEFLDIELDPAGGTYFIHVYYGDAGNAYDLKWQAVPPEAPEIAVFGGLALDVEIVDGDMSPSIPEGTEFGNLNIHGESSVRSFAIRNGGDGVLSVASVSSSSGDFAVLPGFPASVIPRGSGVFGVSFDPSSAGIGQAVITVTCNDPDEGSYDFLVEGAGADGVPDDPYEENNSAAAAYDLGGVDEVWLSSILGPGRQRDPDWFRIEVAPNHDRVMVDCTFSDDEGDIDLRFFDSDLVYMNGSGSGTDVEHMTTLVPGPGTYYIVVTGFRSNSNQGNEYDLRWEQVLAPDDNYEENDTLAAAFDLIGHERKWISNLDGLGRQRDEDWYRLDVTSGYEEVRVHCEFLHDHGDIDISLHDAAGNHLAGSTGIVDNESLVHQVPSGGTYYVRVYYGDANNVYDLWWDDLIPGTAAPLMLVTGVQVTDSGDATIGDSDGRLDPGETVALVVELENRGTLPATAVNATLSTTDPRVTSITGAAAYYGDLNVGRAGSWTYGFTVSPTASAGTIQFDLAVVSNEDTWNRTVNVDLTDGDDPFEPNDSAATAFDLRDREGDWIDGNQFDSDWYLIDVDPSYHRLYVDCEFLHAEGDIDIDVYSISLEHVVGSYSIDDNEHVEINLPAGGEYLIHVYYGDQGNAYRLRWTDGRLIYPNIGVLGFAGTVPIQSGDDSPGSEDGTDLALAPVAGTVVREFVITNEGEADLEVAGITVDNAAFGVSPGSFARIEAGSSAEFGLSFSPPAPGFHEATVSIFSDDPDQGTFTFAVAGQGVTDDAYEENDTLATPYDLTSLAGVWISEVAGDGVSLDDDFYRVDVGPGLQLLEVQCDFSHAAGDINIDLWADSAGIIASSWSWTDDEEFSAVLHEPGTYLVIVWGYGEGNHYDLRWNLSDFDLDDDGLPNYWEQIHTGSETGMDPLGNPDGDRFAHWAEYALGTDPFTFSNPTLVWIDDFGFDAYSYFAFSRNQEAAGIGYRFRVLAGPDPGAMTEGGAKFSYAGWGEYSGWQVYEGVSPLSVADRWFFQLEVLQPAAPP